MYLLLVLLLSFPWACNQNPMIYVSACNLHVSCVVFHSPFISIDCVLTVSVCACL